MGNVAQQIITTLKETGVRYVFGVPSGNWTDYLEAISQINGIDFVLVSNEASGGFMADVHWRLTGNIAACFGTFGPGACNLSTGVCGGYLDRSPMLVIADEMSDTMISRITQMNIDQQTFFKPISKWQTRLTPDNIKQKIFQAYRIACSEVPGPVYIGLPADIGIHRAKKENVTLPAISKIPDPDSGSLEDMGRLFSQSRKPLFALGITSVRSATRKLIHQIIEKFQVPVVQTPMAKGMVPEDHPAYAGVLAHALANLVGATYNQADLVVGIGYDPVEINYETWMPNVPLIHIDTIPADIDKTKVPDLHNVTGNLTCALNRLVDFKIDKKDWDFQALAKRRNQMFAELSENKGELNARAVLNGLQEILPQDSIMTCDVGAHLHLIGQAWKTKSPECQLMTNGCSSMGFGIPAAISAKLSLPERTVACVTGDGGFLMMAGEMATAKRLGKKIIFVVMSDGLLSLIRIKQERKGYPGYGTWLQGNNSRSPDDYFGVPVLAARTFDEFENSLKKAIIANGPIIIEAFIHKEDYEKLILQT